MGPKNGVGQLGGTIRSGRDEERVDVFPHYLLFVSDFENASRRPFTYQRIAVGQPVRATHSLTVKGLWGSTFVLPSNFIGFWINLYHP